MRAPSACSTAARPPTPGCYRMVRWAKRTLLPTPERMTVQRATGMLPSRAADNLFWVGRYVERLEATLRLVRALINRIAEADDTAAPVIAEHQRAARETGAPPGRNLPKLLPALVARAVLTGGELEGSLPWLAGAARSAASVIRDRFSPDAWRALNDLVAVIDAPLAVGPAESAMIERVEAALRIISSFSGLGAGKHDPARRLALSRARPPHRARHPDLPLRAQLRRGDSPDGALDVLLELADSQITYRQRYVMIAALAPVIDLVMLDPNNPRSVAYQLDRIEAHLAALPNAHAAGRLSPVQQIAASIATRLRTADAGQDRRRADRSTSKTR